MKKFILLLCAGVIAFCPVAGITAGGDAECEEEDELNPEDKENCEGYDKIRNECDVIFSCRSCGAGYVLTESQLAGVTYNVCVEKCNTSTNCISDTTWTNAQTGYLSTTLRTCGTDEECVERITYQCAAGYYGTANSSGTSGCSRCPQQDGVYGTSNAGATSNTQCFKPQGTSGRDSGGAYRFVKNTYYCY